LGGHGIAVGSLIKKSRFVRNDFHAQGRKEVPWKTGNGKILREESVMRPTILSIWKKSRAKTSKTLPGVKTVGG